MPENDTPVSHTCPNCGHEFEDDNTTTSTRERWEWTGTIIALPVVLSLPAVILLAGLSIIVLGPITQGWWVLYSTVVLMAATWTFGKETLEAVSEARGN